MPGLSATTKIREATDIEKKAVETLKKVTNALTAGYDRAIKDFTEAYGPTSAAIRAAASKKVEKANADEKKALGYKESFYYV